MHTVDLTVNNFVNPIVDWLNHALPSIPGVVIGVLIGVLGVRILVRVTRFLLTLTNIPRGLRQIITSAVETLFWFFLIIQVLKLLGFNDVLVFFSSSALAIGILLAAGGSTLLSDLVAGIFLARDGDFNIGDEVKAGDPQVQGVIESMDVRRVRLRDEDGLLHVMPNSVVERKEWVLVRKRKEVNALERAVKTAKRIKGVALETKAAVVQKKSRLRRNEQ